MQITINNVTFAKALTIGSQMAGKSKSLPIYDNVKITFKKFNAIISSFDGNSAITKITTLPIPLETEEPISFCISPKDFLATLKTLNDNNVDLDVQQANVKIKHSKGVITLPIISAEEFPTPKTEQDVKIYEVNSKKIFDILKSAKNFVGSDEIRPTMTGIRLLLENNSLKASATDSHYLYDNTIYEGVMATDKAECIIDAKIIPMIMTMINETESTSISVGTSNVIIKAGDCKVIARVIEGKYPNVNAVIPTTHSTTIEVSKKDFINSINRAMITANNTTSMIKLNVQYDNGITIETENLDFAKSSKEEINAKIDGNDIVIGVNGRKMLTCLDSIESEDIILEMTAPNRAIVLKDKEETNKTILIMPVMIQ